ncbi:hypothetical protein FSP39_006501 [Pinctada imbricata]|uniref:Protein N-terminal glutamine amidohydrolase n=1 Tax=Pinctada imbricata TaxID=66713 RepID=A0AA89BNS5_PINIB|nr:hypothetical protein FSP39_006501 [Pinctada imbricata]
MQPPYHALQDPEMHQPCYLDALKSCDFKELFLLIPLWCQQAGHGEEGFVVWDYHVILIHANPQHSSSVYDLDTTLSFPVSFKEYLEKGIRDNQSLREQYWRMFRVIPAREFLARFASDRSHMLKENGEWMMPPPTYPCIKTHDSANNIEDFISMDPHIPHGDVLTVEQLASKFLYLS